jgi:hypothetical protein
MAVFLVMGMIRLLGQNAGLLSDALETSATMPASPPVYPR